jgi:hypothetical protein
VRSSAPLSYQSAVVVDHHKAWKIDPTEQIDVRQAPLSAAAGIKVSLRGGGATQPIRSVRQDTRPTRQVSVSVSPALFRLR